MTINLKGRPFLKEVDFTPEEWLYLLELAAELKAAKKAGTEKQYLKGKNIALIFEKTSTRTRCSFEVGAYDQGANITYLDPSGSQMGHKESVEDTARVLGRMFDGIEFRGHKQEHVETLAKLAGVPVWNGLTDDWHPTQVLADQLTMHESSGKPYNEITFAFVGDTRNNVANSLLVGGALIGMNVKMVGPKELETIPEVRELAAKLAEKSGAQITYETDPKEGVKDCDFIYTDIWVSMGEPDEVWDARIKQLSPYQVNRELLDATGKDAKFLHCLPAFHDRNTTVGEDIFQKTGLDGLEVSNDVFESEDSLVFDEAENRMHTIKAVMVATLGEE
ncbi:ornithine carbamoyltransferase [Flaviflexus ciconiae]|uniref:Ornithine carbamoyltransferase n=1 Tax=Flaviflexus ciconiae TaxID=2496867 RepID=A0A3Q9G4Q7_9ACTO|nr:ornithine carbamoyltransferase [Flaviflexus ciconiae]AZQ77615.1 ornithine carbamoyltransferase [Flaviflexus ciconiae]